MVNRMKKSITIPVASLIKQRGKQKKLVNFRIERDIYAAFQQYCSERCDQGVSQVLRVIIRRICEEEGYIKK